MPPEAGATVQQAGTGPAPNTPVPPKPADTAIPDGPAPDRSRTGMLHNACHTPIGCFTGSA